LYQLFGKSHFIIGGHFVIILRAFHAIQLESPLLDANALGANHIFAREANAVVNGVALVAFDAAVVEGEDHFVVAADFADVRLGEAHGTGPYVIIKSLENCLQEFGEGSGLHLRKIKCSMQPGILVCPPSIWNVTKWLSSKLMG